MNGIDPKQQIILEKAGKTYVTNLKVMLASDLFDKKTGKYTTIRGNKNPPPIGWMASEKWDGIRAIWDGTKFISRGSNLGNPKVYSYVPEWFIRTMPAGVPLDGEFWMGRELFNKVSSLSNLLPGAKYKQSDLDKLWSGESTGYPVIFKIFDIPNMNEPFSVRYEFLTKLVPCIKEVYKYPYKFPLQLSKQVIITSEEQLFNIYGILTGKGAEGLILKNPLSYYEGKRSKNMLKMKIKEDAEALVEAYIPGGGRLEGMIGSLACRVIKEGKLTNIKVNIGTGFTDEMRTYDEKSVYHIPLGSIVSFSYMEMTADSVRHPVFKGIRSDIKLSKK
jgi:DNA ligase 1